ncbi:MAG: glycoside hydrolase family 2 protein [Clostridia bacterium]|nr:glycoside hydrolase family 2 protein [Clostridia bacterium]MBR3591897.1 glycoside hydrolase family 2 protein [Clostridia bacterium]
MQKFILNGNWNMSGGQYNCQGTVPGSVYSFLLDNKLMDDPYYRTNELEACEILEDDFDFSRKFDFSKPDFPVLLHCDGLDTLCDIYINGKHIAYTDNMHRTYEFDVTDALVDGENEIKLHFASPNKYTREMHAKDPVPGTTDTFQGFPHLRKCSCMMGWDWGPRLPDAGIWKDIYLLTVDSDRISEVHITQHHEDGKVYVTPNVTTEKNVADVVVKVTAPCGCEFTIPANVETEIENPKLWWPNGFGEQNLYTITVELVENGKVVDSNTKRIGLRTMRLVQERDQWGESFCHEVNGIRFFAMGADYIPEDNIFSRYSRERTFNLIKQCHDCNFNAIRVWGGGIYPHEDFFDACDEYGLVVFCDLMFACMCIPGYQEFFDNVELEICENLKRIRHRASLAVISGNNEIEEAVEYWWRDSSQNTRKRVYLKLFERLIPKIIDEVCPYVPYISSSPSSGGGFVDIRGESAGDCHYWEVWHGNKPFTEYRNHHFRYLSEFGFESFPCEKTVNSFTLPDERNIFSRTFEMHQRCKGANKKILNYLGDTFLYPTEFGTLLYASQLLQAEAIRYGVEHMRRHRGRCMGALYWQLNDIWPVASWASIDYYGRYKALQYVAKRFFAPVMISCAEIGETTTRPYVVMLKDYDYTTQARIVVTNETTSDVNGTINWELRSADSKIITIGTADVTVPALDTYWLDNIDFNKTDVQNNYLSFSFVVDGNVVSEGTVLFTVPKHFNFVNPNLRYEINGDEITVFADAYAKSVEIDSPDSDFILSDNYFDMNAGSKTVKILEGSPKTIKLRSVYDIR